MRRLGESLRGSVGYRTIRGTLGAEDAATADRRAAEVAAVVAARRPAEPDRDTSSPAASEDATALGRALRALDHVERAARARDTTVEAGAASARRAFALASLRSVFSRRSQILRHAVRTTLGVLLTFVVAWATVGPHDPLVTSMATASFAILQISWTESLLKARQRLLGIAGGAVVMALALWLLPQQWLLPFALLAAVAGLWFIASNQVLSNGSFVIVSVGMNSVGRGLNPTHTLIEYLGLLFTGVALGLLLGFTVVPYLRPDPVDQRVTRARRAAADLLRCLARSAGSANGVAHSVLFRLRRLRTEVANLRSPLHHDDEHAGVDPAACGAVATQYDTLATIGILEAGDGRVTAQELEHAAAILDHPPGREPAGRGDESALDRLAHQVVTGSAALLTAAAAAPPPRPQR